MKVVDFVGRPLATLLFARMRQDELSIAQLACRLGVGRSYLSQLLRGVKSMAALDEQILRACAGYLNVPLVLVYVLAGRLRFDDFLDKAVDAEAQLTKALVQIGESPVAASTGVAVPMLCELPVQVQRLLVVLYERAEQVSLIPRVSLSQVYVLSRSDSSFELRLNRTS